jgi:hypothetical protein
MPLLDGTQWVRATAEHGFDGAEEPYGASERRADEIALSQVGQAEVPYPAKRAVQERRRGEVDHLLQSTARGGTGLQPLHARDQE